jgi:peptidyl-prolyl cis-trans isomerase A (cyclophilin A)
MKFQKWLPILAATAFLFSGCKKSEQPKETPVAEQPKPQPTDAMKSEAPTPAPPDAGGAMMAAAPKPAYDHALLRPSGLRAQAPATYRVKFVTTRGEFTLAVTRAWAPIGADRFYNLVQHHFYDNSPIFRVVPGFVAQFGLSGFPPVSAAWKKTEIKDDPVVKSNKKGTITFATAGPHTRTTQVFINLAENQRLDRMGFAPFGEVEAKGMNVVEMFYDQYGDNGPDQDKLQGEGKPYVDKNFPKIDTIKSATIVP